MNNLITYNPIDIELPKFSQVKLNPILPNYELQQVSKDNIEDVFEHYQNPKSDTDDFKIEEPVTDKYIPKSKQEYVSKMTDAISKALEDNNIDPKVWTKYLVAQTCIESGWGKSSISTKYNNYSGIKGKGSGNVSTREWDPKRGYYTINSSFKKFNSMEDFADQYVKLLKNRFNAFKGTPQEYLKNIRDKNYFTEPLANYTRMFNGVLNTISKYETSIV